jgi:carbonic anhydrase
VSQLLRCTGRKGSGQLFVIHVSGNIPGDDLATLKSAKQFLGVRGILVLGHGNCGAVGAPIKTVQSGATLPSHLPGLIDTPLN